MFKQEKRLLGTKDSYWSWLRETVKAKRDRMYKMVSEAGFRPILPEGSYFMVVDLTTFGN